MAVLLAVYTAEARVGQCDAKCYNAIGGKCECICGGINHGEGFQRAFDNVREMATGMIEKYAQAHNFTIDHFDDATQEAVQPSLWPDLIEPQTTPATPHERPGATSEW